MKKILILAVGGTISMVRDPKSRALKPGLTENLLFDTIPFLKGIASIEIRELFNKDSSNIEIADYILMAREVRKAARGYCGVVITHGTDTLAYTSAALSFMLQNLPIPVILTGSQLPLSDLGSDGRHNLVNAIRLACMDIAEVVILFGSKIIRGTKARKISAFDLEAFTSTSRPLGKVGLNIVLGENRVARSASRRLEYFEGLEKRVHLLKAHPAFDARMLSFVLEAGGRGVVVEGYGSGNLPVASGAALDAISELCGAGIPVVLVSQCVFGSGPLDLYQPALLATEAGAISAPSLTPESATAKLMYVLGKCGDRQGAGRRCGRGHGHGLVRGGGRARMDEIRELMLTNLVGEV